MLSSPLKQKRHLAFTWKRLLVIRPLHKTQSVAAKMRGGPIWPGPKEEPTPEELFCQAKAATATCPSAGRSERAAGWAAAYGGARSRAAAPCSSPARPPRPRSSRRTHTPPSMHVYRMGGLGGPLVPACLMDDEARAVSGPSLSPLPLFQGLMCVCVCLCVCCKKRCEGSVMQYVGASTRRGQE